MRNVSLYRCHGRKMLKGLAHQKEFMVLGKIIIPAKDRCPLEKIIKKLGVRM